MKLILHIDGASRGNPGPAAIGVVVEDESQTVLSEVSEYIGKTTNNVAEYTALIRGLEEAMRLGAQKVSIYSDSELLVKQMNGEYRVKHSGLQPLYKRARSMISFFHDVFFTHVPREQNARADELANQALDQVSKKGVIPKKSPKSTKVAVKTSPGLIKTTSWGSELNLLSVPQLLLNQVSIDSGQELSYEKGQADAFFHVLSGKGCAIVEGDQIDLQAGDSLFISRNIHGTINATDENSLTILVGLIPNSKGEEYESVDST